MKSSIKGDFLLECLCFLFQIPPHHPLSLFSEDKNEKDQICRKSKIGQKPPPHSTALPPLTLERGRGRLARDIMNKTARKLLFLQRIGNDDGDNGDDRNGVRLYA